MCNIAGTPKARIQSFAWSLAERLRHAVQRREQSVIARSWRHRRYSIRKRNRCRRLWQMAPDNLTHCRASTVELARPEESQIAMGVGRGRNDVELSCSAACNQSAVVFHFSPADNHTGIEREILLLRQRLAKFVEN